MQQMQFRRSLLHLLVDLGQNFIELAACLKDFRPSNLQNFPGLGCRLFNAYARTHIQYHFLLRGEISMDERPGPDGNEDLLSDLCLVQGLYCSQCPLQALSRNLGKAQLLHDAVRLGLILLVCGQEPSDLLLASRSATQPPSPRLS